MRFELLIPVDYADEKRLASWCYANSSDALFEPMIWKIISLKHVSRVLKLRLLRALVDNENVLDLRECNSEDSEYLSLLLHLLINEQCHRKKVFCALEQLGRRDFEVGKRLFQTCYDDDEFLREFVLDFVRSFSDQFSQLQWEALNRILFGTKSQEFFNKLICLLLRQSRIADIDLIALIRNSSRIDSESVGELLPLYSLEIFPHSLIHEEFMDDYIFLLHKVTDLRLLFEQLLSTVERFRWVDDLRGIVDGVFSVIKLLNKVHRLEIYSKMMDFNLTEYHRKYLISEIRDCFKSCSCKQETDQECIVSLFFKLLPQDFHSIVEYQDAITNNEYCENWNMLRLNVLMRWKSIGPQPQILFSLVSTLLNDECFEICVQTLRLFDRELIQKANLSHKLEFLLHLSSLLKNGKLGVSIKFISDSIRKRAELTLLAYKTLYAILVSYNAWQRKEMEEVILAFSAGLQKSAGQSAQFCVHIFSVLVHEYQLEMSRMMSMILMKMSQVMSTSNISIHILEFLTLLSDLPQVYCNFVEDDYRRVFGIALLYIQTADDYKRKRLSTVESSYMEYVMTTAYTVLHVWYNCLRGNREKFGEMISRSLHSSMLHGWRNELCLDLLKHPRIMTKGIPEGKCFIFKNYIVILSKTGEYKEFRYGGTVEGKFERHLEDELSDYMRFKNIPPEEEYKLIDLNDSANRRALSVLEQTPNVDLHKIGALYVAPFQQTEDEILSNTSGSPKFSDFLVSLGDVVSLKENSQRVFLGGLDTSDALVDGQYTITWSTFGFQTVFHVPTLMPAGDIVFKKRHIGNDFVQIVWDESQLGDYTLSTIPSQFNYAAIIIRPENDRFHVRSISRDNIRICFDEEVLFFSVEALAKFVRYKSVHLNIYSQILLQMERRNEFQSNTSERQRQIKQIGERNRLFNINESILS